MSKTWPRVENATTSRARDPTTISAHSARRPFLLISPPLPPSCCAEGYAGRPRRASHVAEELHLLLHARHLAGIGDGGRRGRRGGARGDGGVREGLAQRGDVVLARVE